MSCTALATAAPHIADPTELLLPHPAEELEVYPVRPKVNRAGTD